jgi:hypothetical protein
MDSTNAVERTERHHHFLIYEHPCATGITLFSCYNWPERLGPCGILCVSAFTVRERFQPEGPKVETAAEVFSDRGTRL